MAFRDGLYNFEPPSSDEDDTRAGYTLAKQPHNVNERILRSTDLKCISLLYTASVVFLLNHLEKILDQLLGEETVVALSYCFWSQTRGRCELSSGATEDPSRSGGAEAC
ncbi:hypothetical protein TNCV_3933961 [Trichonephila clavipes]|nr:hypothetical protein TNCV_3933961 [Trichonephila clavipes]